jgi:hypothetical protein
MGSGTSHSKRSIEDKNLLFNCHQPIIASKVTDYISRLAQLLYKRLKPAVEMNRCNKVYEFFFLLAFTSKTSV